MNTSLLDLFVIAFGLFLVLAAFAMICLSVVKRANRQPARADLESVPCSAGCGTSLLVAKGAIHCGVTVTCLKCWTAQHPSRPKDDLPDRPQDVCENCECAMPEGCRGELWAEDSCRLKQQGGA